MSSSPTLYERLGGEAGVESLVTAFYDRVLQDPELEPFFRNTPVAHLRSMQKEFFAMSLDGPVTYSGRPLAWVHHGRGITARHFSLFVDHLLATIGTLGIGDAEAREVISRINTFANEITGASY